MHRRSYGEIKRPTRCKRLVSLLQNLLFAQHVERTVRFAIKKNQSVASSWPFNFHILKFFFKEAVHILTILLKCCNHIN